MSAVLALPASAAQFRPYRRPLVRLGALLESSLPGIAERRYAPPVLADGTSPAGLSPGKAAALVREAWAEAGSFPRENPGFMERRRPAEVILQAVNSMLLDIAEPDLPGEDLQALSSLIFDRLHRQDQPNLWGVQALSEASLRRQLALRGEVLEHVENPVPEPYFPRMVTISGVPEAVRPVSDRLTLWRHYTSRLAMESILAERRLLNAVVPYIAAAGDNVWKIFNDLTGLFLTLPNVPPERIGVGREKHQFFVDVRLPPSLAVLELEPGAIYMLPLPRRTPRELRRLYARWAAGRPLPPEENYRVRQLDFEGGPGPDAAVPVEIVKFGKVRFFGRRAGAP